MSDKRRLLVISHGFPPYYGGAEHVAGHLAAAAVSSGRWNVDVLTSDIGGRLAPRDSWRGVTVVRVPGRKREWTNHTVSELLYFQLSALRRYDLKRPDWILAHFSLPRGEVARQIAAKFGVPYTVVLHGSDVPGYQNSRFRVAYALVRPWIRRIWRSADHVISVSNPLRELALCSWPEGKISVVHNGVDIERFRPDPAGKTWDNEGRVVLTTVAQLIERKGIQHLIAALLNLPEPLNQLVYLRLCGVGDFEGELRRQVREAGLQDQVDFAGLVAYEEVPAFLRQSDVFVLPSLQEGLPLALLEAMASGLPVIATAVGGIPGVVRNGKNGLLVPVADSLAICNALVRLLADPVLRQRLGESARADAQGWSWKAVWERYETFFLTKPAPDSVREKYRGQNE